MQIVSPVALVLCGGGSRGAREVGFYRRCASSGLPVDLVVGTTRAGLNGSRQTR